jgi:hypothetical protein
MVLIDSDAVFSVGSSTIGVDIAVSSDRFLLLDSHVEVRCVFSPYDAGSAGPSTQRTIVGD